MSCSSWPTSRPRCPGTSATPAWTGCGSRSGAPALAPFPSLRVDETTIIDLIPGHDGSRGHLDHVCFVVAAPDLDAVRACPDCTVEDEGPRFGARGMGTSVYVRDPDGLLVEFRTYG